MLKAKRPHREATVRSPLLAPRLDFVRPTIVAVEPTQVPCPDCQVVFGTQAAHCQLESGFPVSAGPLPSLHLQTYRCQKPKACKGQSSALHTLAPSNKTTPAPRACAKRPKSNSNMLTNNLTMELLLLLLLALLLLHDDYDFYDDY